MNSWLSSPLAINYLLSLCKNGPSYHIKYLQTYRDIKIKKGFVTSNKLFLSPLHNAQKQYDISNISIQNIQFMDSNDARQRIMEWIMINQCRSLSQLDIDKYVLPNTKSLLCNITVFKSVWNCSQPNPVMKVHNSFSYTEDIKYEARLLELPMEDSDFKLVIVIPNEPSSIRGLFSKLVEEGMPAAVSCIQPLFSFSTVLEAPCIEFRSENAVCFNANNCNGLNAIELGNVQINDDGTNISILTLLSSSYKNLKTPVEEQSDSQSPFYFAVLYKDAAIFTGRFVNRF